VLPARVVIAEVEYVGSSAVGHRPDCRVVLAGQAVEPATGEAGDPEILADPYLGWTRFTRLLP
jgi:hypothetical protein